MAAYLANQPSCLHQKGATAKFGVVLPQKADTIRPSAHLERENLPLWASRAVANLLVHITVLDQRIAEYNAHLEQLARRDERCGRLMHIPGLGPITATALLASVGNGHDFKNGRQLAVRAPVVRNIIRRIRSAENFSKWPST